MRHRKQVLWSRFLQAVRHAWGIYRRQWDEPLAHLRQFFTRSLLVFQSEKALRAPRYRSKTTHLRRSDVRAGLETPGLDRFLELRGIQFVLIGVRLGERTH